MTNLITNYESFNYNNEFIPTYNIFNVSSSSISGNVGIGINNPQNILEVENSSQFIGNMNIKGNIFFNKNYIYDDPNNIHTLFYNKLTKSTDIATLKYSSPYQSNINWKETSNGIILGPQDNLTNTNIFQNYKFNSNSSSFYYNSTTKKLDIDLISNSKIVLKYISIYNKEDNTKYTGNILFNSIDTTSSSGSSIAQTLDTTNKLNGIYELNKPYTLSPNNFHNFTIENIQANLSIELIGKHDYDAGSYWYNTVHSNKYINRKIGINKQDNLSSELTINGDSYIDQNLNSSVVKTNNLINNGVLNVDGFLYTKYLQSMKPLSIDVENMYIGSNNKLDKLCVIKETTISKDGVLQTDDIYIKNNIDVSEILCPTVYNKLEINEAIKVKSKFYSDHQINQNSFDNPPNIDKELLIINNDKVNINTKCIITDKNNPSTISKNYALYVDDYDMYGKSIEYNNIYIKNIDYIPNEVIYNINTLKTAQIRVNGLAEFHNVNSKNIYAKTLESNYINFNPSNNISENKPGTIYLEKTDNNFYGYLKNQQKFKFENTSTPVSSTNNVVLNNINTPLLDILNNINTPLLDILNVHSEFLYTKNITSKSIELPQKFYNINNSCKSILQKKNGKYNISDGINNHNLLINNTNEFYLVELKYNPIKLQEQFSLVFNPDVLYNITLLPTNKIKISEDNNDNSLQFYIKNNKIYTKDNKNTYITLYDITKLNNIYNASYKFDKGFDKNNLIYVHLTKFSFENKYFKLTTEKIDNIHNILKVTILDALNTDENKHKFKIKDYQLYNYDNIGLPIYIYNIMNNTTNLTAYLIHATELIKDTTLNNLNNIIYAENIVKFGFGIHYLNHNSICNIHNSKIYTVLNKDTKLNVINKRYIGADKYEAYISLDLNGFICENIAILSNITFSLGTIIFYPYTLNYTLDLGVTDTSSITVTPTSDHTITISHDSTSNSVNSDSSFTISNITEAEKILTIKVADTDYISRMYTFNIKRTPP